jgi:hypothetical protein
MPRLLLAIALLVALAPAPVAAVEQIEPDRPEQTDSARLAPAGGYQLEAGVVYSKERRAGAASERTFTVEADLRIGIARQLELDLEGEPFVRVRGPEDDTGFGDVALALRYRVLEPRGDESWPPHVAFKPFVKLPTAGEPIGSGRPDFGLVLLASFALPWDFELEANVGGAAVGVTHPNGYLGQALVSASLSRDLLPSLFGFAEVLYRSRAERDDRDGLAFNTGLVYRVSRTFTVDAAVQTSLVGQGPDYLFRAGLSVLFGH